MLLHIEENLGLGVLLPVTVEGLNPLAGLRD
jgi:hypothetical protein